jgi:hypothetical protein
MIQSKKRAKIQNTSYTIYRPAPIKSTSKATWRKMCCVPYAVIYLIIMALTMASIIMVVISLEHVLDEELPDQLLTSTTPASSSSLAANQTNYIVQPKQPKILDKYGDHFFHLTATEERVLTVLLVVIAVSVGLMIVANIYTLSRVAKSLVFSQRRHLQSAVAKLDLVKSEGYLQVNVVLFQKISKFFEIFIFRKISKN